MNSKQAYHRNYYLRTKDQARNRYIQAKYNITAEEYNSILEKQNGCCAICKKPPDKHHSKLCVDHNHKTGKVRGILCVTCNSGIGKLGDTIAGLKRAIKYLEKSSCRSNTTPRQLALPL